MGFSQASGSNVAASTPFDRVKTLCKDAVYLFHEPVEQKPEVEIVFIHGLQLGGSSKEAYLTTWLARDGTGDNCWPTTWLAGKFPNARILSLSYDVNALQSATHGWRDSYSLGEKLVQEMVLPGVGIGQSGCPVVFVCHSLGGLIAKQIIVSGHKMSSRDGRIHQLLCNVEAFIFYATPHRGSKLANLAKSIPSLSRGPLMDYLEHLNNYTGRLNDEFEYANQEVSSQTWKFYGVGETHATKYGPFNRIIVEEASARNSGYNFMCIAANHFDVCKPESEVDSSFLYLVECVREVVLKFPRFLVGMKEQMKELQSKLEVNPIVGLVGMGV